jgi:hypothetical protein
VLWSYKDDQSHKVLNILSRMAEKQFALIGREENLLEFAGTQD